MSSLSEWRKMKLVTGNNGTSLLLPGFRFHPTEEELVGFYLHRMVEGKGAPDSLIPLVEFYSHDPWDLPRMAPVTENVWFFFVPRDRKYPNGARPNRVTASGYWKATGTDRKVTRRGHCIGLKKTLVFYRGRAPKGTKTNWIMNEFRLPHTDNPNAVVKVDVTLCRVYKKANSVASPRFLNGYKPSIAMHREAQQAIVKDEHLVASTFPVFAHVHDQQHEQLVPSKDPSQIPCAGTDTEMGSSNTTDESSGLVKLFVDDNPAMQLAWLDDEVHSYNSNVADGDACASNSQKAGMQLEVPVRRNYWQQDSPGLFVTPTSMDGLLRTVQPCWELGNDPQLLHSQL